MGKCLFYFIVFSIKLVDSSWFSESEEIGMLVKSES